METELGRIVRAVRRFWWIAVVVAVIFGGVAASMGALSSKTYTSETTVLVTSDSELMDNPSTIIQLILSDVLLRPILADLGIDAPPETFRNSNLDAYAVPNTSFVMIEVTHVDPEIAADAANAIAASASVRSYDIGLGVLQRDLDNLIFERDQISNQLATVNAQIDQLSESSGELSAEDQVQSDQLETDRLLLEQRRSDLDSRIRTQQTSIATFVEPVMVSDEAVPSDNPDGVSPVILGAVGVVLGAVLGLVMMLVLELRDPNVRDDDHLRELIGSDSVTSVDRKALYDTENPSIPILASRTAGIARSAGSDHIAVISPRPTEASQSAAGILQKSSYLADLSVISSVGLLDDAAGIRDFTSNTAALLLVEQGKTSTQDVVDVIDILRDMGVPAVSAALFE